MRVLIFVLLFLIAGTSEAQTYPSRPIRLILPFAAGGLVDVPGRILAQKLSADLGQPLVVENRPGAGSTIGADVVAKSKPDGYTLMITSTTHVITGAIVGVGATTKLSAVRWGVAGRIVWAWVLTIPASSAIAIASWWLMKLTGAAP